MIRLTPETLAAAYDFLCTLPPYDGWNLPSSDDIKFIVTRSRTVYGSVDHFADGAITVNISGHLCKRIALLLATMAHELVHVHQFSACIMGRNRHDKTFQLLADEVCKHHPDFDRAVF